MSGPGRIPAAAGRSAPPGAPSRRAGRGRRKGTCHGVVGAYARIEIAGAAATVDRLGALPGVETFDLDDPGKVGLLIEAEDLDGAHEALTRRVRGARGVLGVWPIYVHDESDPEAARKAVSEAQ